MDHQDTNRTQVIESPSLSMLEEVDLQELELRDENFVICICSTSF